MAKKSASRAPNADDRVVAIVGKELFLRSQYTAMLRTALTEAHGEIDSFVFDGNTVDAAAVLDECRSFGLMASHKLVIVDDADAFVNAETRPLLERYAGNPNEQATLVLRGARWVAGNLDKAIAKVGMVLKCDSVDEATAQRWIMARTTKHHKSSIDARTAAQLVQRLGTDLGRIDTELGKLAVAAGAGNPITAELVTQLVGMTREEEAWAIQEFLLSGDTARILGELRVILSNAPKGAHVPVSFACTDLARKVLGIAEGMKQGVPVQTLAKEMKLWGPSRDPILQAARAMGPARARGLFDACIDADRSMKSSGTDPVRRLERLAVEYSRALGR
ncbi:MAG: DNA polymerase III subunit delta [Phycisphaerales bacterium]|nr:DNA polymerase III subunit delta [Phycisphaerales bacterium]